MEKNANKLNFLITSNIVIHPQILIFLVLKIYVGTLWDSVYQKHGCIIHNDWFCQVVASNRCLQHDEEVNIMMLSVQTVFRMCYVCQVVEAAGDTVDVHTIPRRHETSAETLQWCETVLPCRLTVSLVCHYWRNSLRRQFCSYVIQLCFDVPLTGFISQKPDELRCMAI